MVNSIKRLLRPLLYVYVDNIDVTGAFADTYTYVAGKKHARLKFLHIPVPVALAHWAWSAE